MIRSFWFAAVVAGFLGIATSSTVLLARWGEIADPPSSTAKHLVTARERGWDFWSGEIDRLSSELKKERAALETRRKDLDALAIRLGAEKQELLRVRGEVDAIREEISQQIPVLQASEKSNLKNLSRSYSAMKPRQAVAILSEMDDATAVKILAVMKPDTVGAVLQEMATPGTGTGNLAARAARLSDFLRLLKQEDVTQTP